eukprot:1695658-Pyramimonas_sp.AAC.1
MAANQVDQVERHVSFIVDWPRHELGQGAHRRRGVAARVFGGGVAVALLIFFLHHLQLDLLHLFLHLTWTACRAPIRHHVLRDVLHDLLDGILGWGAVALRDSSDQRVPHLAPFLPVVDHGVHGCEIDDVALDAGRETGLAAR